MKPWLIYQVAVGGANPVYDSCIVSVARYCERHAIDHVVQREPILRICPRNNQRSDNALRLGYLPIFEKENAIDYLDRYEAVCVIDSDIYIMPDAPCIFDQLSTACFYAAQERDMPVNTAYRNKIKKYSEAQYGPLRSEADFDWQDGVAAFCNMGMIMLTPGMRDHMQADSARGFLERADFQRFINGEGAWRWSTDQTLLNYWIRHDRVPFQILDWRWNALYGAVVSERMPEAWFVHFFLSVHNVGQRSVSEIISEITACKHK